MGIPKRLLRNGRPVDNSPFRPYHYVYFRFEAKDVIGGNRVNPNSIRYFNMSVNWSKYSWPLDVIIGSPKCGIAQLLAAYLPTMLPKELLEKQKPHKFALKHDPKDENYSHCEVIVIKDSSRIMNNTKISEAAKKEYRTFISDKSFIVLDGQK